MMNTVKKLFVYALIISFSQLANTNTARIISNYPQLLKAINQGDSIRAIMFINKCSITHATSDSNDVIAGMNFTTFNKYQVEKGNQKINTIATSINMLVEDGKLGTVYNYVRLRIFEDNSAEILSEYLDPTTYKQLGSISANCTISNDHDKNGIVLYDVSYYVTSQ